MALPFRLTEECKITEAMTPATDAAGRTSTVVTLKYAHKAYIVFHVAQGSASTILLSLLQGTGGAGTQTLTGSKACPACPIWWNVDTSLSDTLVLQTAAATFTTDSGTKNKIFVAEIDPMSLDVANGFKDVAISTGASSASNITQAMWYVFADRYSLSTPPTVITD